MFIDTSTITVYVKDTNKKSALCQSGLSQSLLYALYGTNIIDMHGLTIYKTEHINKYMDRHKNTKENKTNLSNSKVKEH